MNSGSETDLRTEERAGVFALKIVHCRGPKTAENDKI